MNPHHGTSDLDHLRMSDVESHACGEMHAKWPEGAPAKQFQKVIGVHGGSFRGKMPGQLAEATGAGSGSRRVI